jgi:alkylation response protein AidB-like acyl-CoA dehydrogenase
VSESLASFCRRAHAWVDANLPSRRDAHLDARELQRLLFDHGYAGLSFPIEYGGGGLTLDHQKAFYDLADELDRQVPTGYELLVSIGMLGPTILDHGSHEAKLRFLPPLLRGDEIWIQLLSEPRGGSDMAGAMTRLTRDGSDYIVSGSKMWSTGAHLADFGLCLCRSDWDVPKHRGLSMIAVPLQGTPGLTVRQIRAADGRSGEFCEEFFDDVVLPETFRIGEENSGWAVAQTLLLHERNAAGGIGYGYLTAAGGAPQHEGRVGAAAVAELASRAIARGASAAVAQQVADAYIEAVVGPLMSERLMLGLRLGAYKGQWGSLAKLQSSVAKHATVRATLAVDGADGVVWDGADVVYDNVGTRWLGSRGVTLAGGSNEMQRNIISERLLGLPREPSADRDRAFGDVVRGGWDETGR